MDEIPVDEIQGRVYRAEITVADKGNTDKTREIAESKGARLITEPRRGKDRAIRTAVESADVDSRVIPDADKAYMIIDRQYLLRLTYWEMYR